MPTINGRKCRSLVQARTPFKSHGAIYGRKCGPYGYAVFSYGEHWPLFVWDGHAWFENTDRYSVTTSKHRGYTHPHVETQPRTCEDLIRSVAQLEQQEGVPEAFKDAIPAWGR